MKNTKRAGWIAATGFAALIFTGVAVAPAMAAETNSARPITSSSTSAQVSTLDPNWGPEDAELGVALRYVNKTAESVTIGATSYEQSDGGFTLKPGESMWVYNSVFAGVDLRTTATVGSSPAVAIDGKRPSCGTSWINVGGTEVKAGNTSDVTAGSHSFNVTWNGENLQKEDGVDRWTVTINA